MATRKDVARLASVSVATVSRVFSNDPRVKNETRQKVLKAAKTLHYEPNALARAVALRQSHNIGLVVHVYPNRRLFAYDYFNAILDGLADEARTHHYDIVLLQRSITNPIPFNRYFSNKKIDGAIFIGATLDDQPTLYELARTGNVFVVIGHELPHLEHMTVNVNHIQGSFDAIAHLYQQGHHNIAFINGEDFYSDSHQRIQGIRLAMSNWRDLVVHIYRGRYDAETGYEMTDIILQQQPRPTAIFTANDLIALGVSQKLKSEGLEPGRDIALVGYDDSQLAAFHDPPLSSVHVPLYDLGKTAGMQLFELIRAKKNQLNTPPASPYLPARLIIRASSLMPL